MAVANEDQEVSLADQMMADSGISKTTISEKDIADDKPATGEAAKDKGAPDSETEGEAAKNAPAKTAEQIAAEAAAENAPAKTAEQIAAEAAAAKTAIADPDADIDDEKLLAFLRKKTGREFKSLDELKEDKKELTEDEKKAAAEQVRSEAIEFGKANKLFTQAQYDQFISFSGLEKVDVVQADFVARKMKEDTDLTKEDAEDLFNEFFHRHEDIDSPKYKEAQNLIDQQYDQIKRKDFGSILDVTTVYSDVQKNTARATSYQNQLETLFTSKIPAKFDFVIDGETVSYPIDLKNKNIAEIVSGIKADYLTVPMMNSTLDQTGKVDEAALLSSIEKDLQIAVLKTMVAEVAKSYSDTMLIKAKMGRKGAIDLETETSGAGKVKGVILGESDKLLQEAGMLPPGQQRQN